MDCWLASFVVRTGAVADRLRTFNFHSWSEKTFLANAIASVRLVTIPEFHLYRRNTNASACPFWSLPRGFQKPTKKNRSPIPFFPAPGIQAAGACFKHCNLFKVNVPAHRDTRSRAPRRDCVGLPRDDPGRQDVTAPLTRGRRLGPPAGRPLVHSS